MKPGDGKSPSEQPGPPSGRFRAAKDPAGWWIRRLSRLGAGRFWAAIWGAALAVPFLPAIWLAALVPAVWLSAAVLASGRHHGRILVAAALAFLLFWGLLTGLIGLLQPTSLRPVLNLAAWLGLGLNLMLAKTPLELALSLGRFLRPFLGRINSQKLALALALLARLIPGLLASALETRSVLKHRAAHLPLTRRLALWGRSLIRNTLAQADDLSRALLKRWPW